jgi:hypothetical protein
MGAWKPPDLDASPGIRFAGVISTRDGVHDRDRVGSKQRSKTSAAAAPRLGDFLRAIHKTMTTVNGNAPPPALALT